ncbi:Protein BPS1, chloroplastic [Glycine soja]|uniref:Protein BPS1, chloroplastic n=1 Tax=Glycine soja TaxID=3848 RepID=A0A0B2P7W8_GLYSO|nr:Protein BPS1, chloroplastic [Glycine soja]
MMGAHRSGSEGEVPGSEPALIPFESTTDEWEENFKKVARDSFNIALRQVEYFHPKLNIRMSRSQDPHPSRSFFPFGNPFRMISPKGSRMSPQLLAVLQAFEATLAERLKNLMPKSKDEILTLSWMTLAMKSLCESHNDIWTLMTALELPVSDWEDKWIDVYLDISSKLLDICNAFSSELSRLNQGNLPLKCALHNLDYISVSKVAKILTKFVSANNSASHVINAYHHRASASFNELKQLHKELGSSHSHKKHKRHRTKNGNDSGKVVGNSVQSVDINKELSLGHVKFDQFKRQQSGSGNADQDDENFSQQLDGFIGYQIENVDEGEMHKKKKKKKQEVESLHDIDSTVKFGVREADGKLPNGSQKESESTREQGNEGNINAGMEEGRKQKSGKKHKVSTSSFSSYKGEANNGKDLEQQKEMEKTSCNGFEGENGGLGSSQDLQIKKKKNHNLDSASSKQYLQACSLLDDWRQHHKLDFKDSFRGGVLTDTY